MMQVGSRARAAAVAMRRRPVHVNCVLFHTQTAATSLAPRPSEIYKARVQDAALTHDDAQWRVTKKFLDKLHRQLHNYRLPVIAAAESESMDSTESRVGARETKEQPVLASEQPVLVPRGLYVHGHVGTGKSMLMDLFFEHVHVPHKRRVHFNKFMLDVHQRLQRVKKQHLDLYGRQRNIVLDPSRDAISIVAEELVLESHVLCFDEFQVTDIADAMIMRKLFAVFFSRGGVMIATSNTPPMELYKDGTNREYFLPFLQQLTAHTKIVDMTSLVDHRTNAQPHAQQSFFYPLSPETRSALATLVDTQLTCDSQLEHLRIPVMMGRHLDLRQATRGGVAIVSFDELCNTEKGAADYRALSEHFHTVVLTDVPQLEMDAHDQARRFILLIDELYEHRTRLVSSAAVAPREIFQFDDAPLQGHAEAMAASQLEQQQQREQSEKQGIPASSSSSWDAPVGGGGHTPAKMAGLQVTNLCSLQDLKIAFKRAVSRLSEMQSEKYLLTNGELRGVRQSRLKQSLSH